MPSSLQEGLLSLEIDLEVVQGVSNRATDRMKVCEEDWFNPNIAASNVQYHAANKE